MSLMAQAKLLRVLEERRFERLGGNASIEVNFRSSRRPIARSTSSCATRGQGRPLLPLSNAFSIAPAVAPRAHDRHPVLAHCGSWRATARRTASRSTASPSRRKRRIRCCRYHWPGNIRELESTVSRAALSSPGRTIRPQDIEFLHAAETPVESSRERLPSLADAERAHIARVLESVSWNKKQAAAVLEISRGTLYRKIVEYGLEEAPPPSRKQNIKGRAVPRIGTRRQYLLQNDLPSFFDSACYKTVQSPRALAASR